ncbi:MAG: hypothetical protein WA051_00705 [Minisyncoccia bacterium]
MSPVKSVLFVFSLAVLLFASSSVGAQQFINTGVQTGDISITIRPEYPSPNEDVEVTIESSSFQLNSLPITWLENGVELKNYKNQVKISVPAGNLGKSKTITARIDVDGTLFDKEIVIQPSTIDLLWEGRTLTPYWYMGKSLFTRGSKLVINAIPFIYDNSGKRIGPSQLLYTWLVNDSLVGSSMARGLQSIIITGSVLGITENVELKVYSASGTQLSEKKIDFSPKSPFTRWYEQNSLYGEQQIALPNSISVTSGEVSLRPEPFFISPNANYRWSIGNKNADIGSEKYITLKSETPAQNVVSFEAVDNTGKSDGTSGDINVSLKP